MKITKEHEGKQVIYRVGVTGFDAAPPVLVVDVWDDGTVFDASDGKTYTCDDTHGSWRVFEDSPSPKPSPVREFETKDSGERRVFDSGMQRDTSTGKTRFDLVDFAMFNRWAELMTRGAAKYDPNNWRKADGQAELDRFRESAVRHFMTWLYDLDTTEDHAAAVYFNVAGCEYVLAKMRARGDTPKGLPR